jgi:hypothetical protein
MAEMTKNSRSEPVLLALRFRKTLAMNLCYQHG